MLQGIQRFRTIGSKSFLGRGTVRRGVWIVFLEFAAFEREKMLLHIFRAESGALAKRRGIRHGKRKSPATAGVEDLNGRAARVYGTGRGAV
jgi:hypothetical protein